MIPRIKSFQALDNFLLWVEFEEGRKVIYDVKEDMENIPSYKVLGEIYGLFKQVQMDTSRTCLYWNKEVDLSSDSIYEYGKEIREK